MSGWYPDPTGRFEYRYHNDRHWTSDVATNGQRYLDPLPSPPIGPSTGASAAPAPTHEGGGGNGMAVAAMVCGIVALVIAWIPFVGVLGLAAALTGLGLSVPAMRRSKPTGARRGAAITGLVTSSIAVVLGILGIVLTVYLVRAFERFDDPGPTSTQITSCTADGTDVVATGELTNRSDSTRDYTVEVRLATGSTEWVKVQDVPAGGSESFEAREFGTFREGACEVLRVRGPVPFDLDPSVFEE